MVYIQHRCKKFLIITLIVSIASVFSIGAVIYNYSPAPNKIFFNACKSVVELKASSNDVGESFGTAVCIKDEFLVTNAHVVTYKKLDDVCEFEMYQIRTSFEEEYHEVQLIKYDVEMDIAILKFKADDVEIRPIKTGNSDKLISGEKVYAVGNGSNYGLSITEGIVSMAKLNIEYNDIIREVIQSDVTIASGNSGGALLNSKGNLMGITTFRTKDDAGNVVYGLVYSIPVNEILEYANK